MSGLQRVRPTIGRLSQDYGVIADGTSHPLSERFATLAAAQAVYPDAVALTDEIDWHALNRAIAAATNAAVGKSSYVDLPTGTYMLHKQLVVPTFVVLRGAGRGTILKASAAFPTSTALVRIGDGTKYAFGSRLENLCLYCNNVAGSIGLYTTDLQEQSGCIGVLITQYRDKGVFIDAVTGAAGGTGASNYLLRDMEIWASAAATGSVAVDINGGSWKNDLTNITIDTNAGAATQLAGIRATDCRLHCRGIHIEEHTDGILLAGTSTHAVIDSVTSLNCTNTIRSVSGQLGRWVVLHAFRSGGTNVVLNENLSHALIGAVVAMYAQDGGANSYAQTSTSLPGIPSNFTELSIGAGQPMKKHLHANVTLNFPSIAAGTYADLTATVTGANGGNTVQLGPPAAIEAGLLWSAWVSAANTVTVRLFNATANPIDPASNGWRIAVTAH